ncbi:MAG: hypothetical protein F4Y01_16470 [Gammaproteobacteria bacterium]|nr:hypothetical protein [Gammaproteobacteria bacterium]
MLDPALEESLAETIKEAGQPETVARRLTAWLRRMAQGSPVEEDEARFLTAVFEVLDLEDEDAD